jgi:glycosyltransferase involved in cell wall biosynthesis
MWDKFLDNWSDVFTDDKKTRAFYLIKELAPTAKKVLVVVGSKAGVGWYRFMQPIRNMHQYNADKVNIAFTNFIAASDYSTTEWDVIIYQRQYFPKVLELAKALRNNPVVQVYDLDDDVFSINTYNPAAEEYTTEVQNAVKDFLHTVDHVVVSTNYLAAELRKYNEHIHVIPNAIDFDLFDKYAKQETDYRTDSIIVGWSGSATHRKDLKDIAPAIQEVMKRNPAVRFQLGGWINCPVFKELLDPHRVDLIPWTQNINEHFKNTARIDIALTPLWDEKFNYSKSNLKYLEHAALGIPVIASNVGPYAETINDGLTGILVNPRDGATKRWITAIESLVTSVVLRKKIGTAGREFVKKQFNARDVGTQYANLLTTITKTHTVVETKGD